MFLWWGIGGATLCDGIMGVAPLAVGRCGTGIVQLNLLISCRIFERLLEDFCFGVSGGSSGGDFTRSENKVPGARWFWSDVSPIRKSKFFWPQHPLNPSPSTRPFAFGFCSFDRIGMRSKDEWRGRHYSLAASRKTVCSLR